MDRKFSPPKFSYTSVVITAFLMIIPALANALVITLEPDDYGMDAPLQNEYVTVGSSDGSPYNLPPIIPIRAKNYSSWDADYKAPTGELTFGNFSFFPATERSDWSGLVLSFNQAVSRVTMLANSGYRDRWFNSAGWVALDQNGEEIGSGSAGVPEGQGHLTFEIDIQLENIWKVIMGGAESIPYIYFDHLTFEVPAVSVPEPNPLFMLLVGIACLVLCRRMHKVSK